MIREAGTCDHDRRGRGTWRASNTDDGTSVRPRSVMPGRRAGANKGDRGLWSMAIGEPEVYRQR